MLIAPDLLLTKERLQELDESVTDEQFSWLEKNGRLDNWKTYAENVKEVETAEREAKARLRDNSRLNDAEFAYSPSTGAVGIRWDDSSIFRVFNVNYPMYQRSELVKDWVSVGKGNRK